MMKIQIKRIYEKAHPSDGFRVLVDRLWPRGVSKQSAKIDLWAKDIAPSTELRRWFGHDPKKWETFKKRYKGELKKNRNLVELYRSLPKGVTTLVYGAKNEKMNNAVILKELLDAL